MERDAASDPGSAAGWPNLVTMFFDQADRFGERPLLWAKRDQHYRPLGWRDVAARVCGLARGLRALGIEHGDRVLVVAENRPEWLISDLAIMATGGVTVPAYTTNTEADQRYLLEDSGAKGAIVSTARLARTLLAAMEPGANTPPPFVVMMEKLTADARLEPPAGVQVLTWDDVVARGERDHSNVLCNADQVAPTDLACIIYTSGTGGTPKGVMLQHEAILHNCAGAIEVVRDIGPGNDTFLSFLPLSHAFEHTVGQFVPLALGAEIFYAEGIDRVGANMLEARPTIIAAVPRFYELLRQRILHGVQKQSALRRRLFDRTIAFGTRRAEDPHGLGLAERLVDWGLDHSVRSEQAKRAAPAAVRANDRSGHPSRRGSARARPRRAAGGLGPGPQRPRTVRQRFGGRIRAMVSGGAPLSEEVGAFFVALGLPLFQGYGQTEAAPLISVNRPGQAKLGTVGPPLPGVEIRIAEDGEILARGKMVMKGYWRNEEATREAIRDGWLHTGDIGRIDEDGHIRITDRKKDIIVNSGGDNLSPARVEAALTLRPEIAQAMVYGDRKPHLVALIVPDPAWARSWAAAAGKAADIAALADDGDFHRAIGAIVDEVNKTLSVIERVRRFIVVAQSLFPRQRPAHADAEAPPPRDPRGVPGQARRPLRGALRPLAASPPVVVAVPGDEAGHALADVDLGGKAEVAARGLDVGVGLEHVARLHRLVLDDRLPPGGGLDGGDEVAQVLAAVVAEVVDPVDAGRRRVVEAAEDPVDDVVDVGEVAAHLAAVVDRDRPALEDLLGEHVGGHVRPPPRAVDGEEAQPRQPQAIHPGVGVADHLHRLLGRAVEGNGAVGPVFQRERQLVVGAVNRRRRGVDQVAEARQAPGSPPAARRSPRCCSAGRCTGSRPSSAPRPGRRGGRWRRSRGGFRTTRRMPADVAHVEPLEAVPGEPVQGGAAAFRQRRIVARLQVVDADHGFAAPGQGADDMKADEPGDAGNERAHLCFPPIRRMTAAAACAPF